MQFVIHYINLFCGKISLVPKQYLNVAYLFILVVVKTAHNKAFELFIIKILL